LAQRFLAKRNQCRWVIKKRRCDLSIIQHILLSNKPDARSNGRDRRTAAKMATSPLIHRKSEMAMAMVSTRSSCRSFSSCWALRNEASEAGVRCSGSGNPGSGGPSVGKMQSPVQNLARRHAQEGESAHRSGLPRHSKRAPHVLQRLQIRLILLSMVAQSVCAGVRDAIVFWNQHALYKCCVAIVLQMEVLKYRGWYFQECCWRATTNLVEIGSLNWGRRP